MKRKSETSSLLFLNKITVLVLMLGLIFVGSAIAIPMLRLSDGTSTVGLTDTDGDGIISYQGGIGVFWASFSVGITNPAIGSSTFPMMHLDHANISGGTGTMNIWFTKTGFSSPTVPGNSTKFYTHLGGVTGGNVTLTSHYDLGNAAFGTSGTLSSLGTFGPGSFSSSDVSSDILADPFSMTLHASVYHPGVNVMSFDAQINPVPEPATILLMGTGLLGLLASGRKRNSNKQA